MVLVWLESWLEKDVSVSAPLALNCQSSLPRLGPSRSMAKPLAFYLREYLIFAPGNEKVKVLA